MTAAPERHTTDPAATTAASPYPTRFREAEDRSRRIGRTLKAVARVDEVDEQLMDRLGRGYLERDELGNRLAAAMRLRSGEPGAVSRRQLDEALTTGTAGLPEDAAPVLREAEPLPQPYLLFLGDILGAYAIAGLLVVLIMRMLAEMASALPASGSFSVASSRGTDPSRPIVYGICGR